MVFRVLVTMAFLFILARVGPFPTLFMFVLPIATCNFCENSSGRWDTSCSLTLYDDEKP